MAIEADAPVPEVSARLAGVEESVDAYGCEPGLLTAQPALLAVLDALVRERRLTVILGPFWHVFPGAGGITGVAMLAESHLACHTFPERGYAAFNLFSCRPIAAWPWQERLARLLGSQHVEVVRRERGGNAR